MLSAIHIDEISKTRRGPRKCNYDFFIQEAKRIHGDKYDYSLIKPEEVHGVKYGVTVTIKYKICNYI